MNTPYGPPGSDRPQPWGQQLPNQSYPPGTPSGPPGTPSGNFRAQDPNRNYPPGSYGQPGWPQPGYGHPGYPPPGYGQQGYPPQPYPPQGYPQPYPPPQPAGHPAYGQGYGQPQRGEQDGPQPYAQPAFPPPAHPVRPQPFPTDLQGPGTTQPGYRTPAKKPVLTWILSGVGGSVVIGAILFLGFVNPGFFTTTVFDQTAVQDGVQQILFTEYGQNAQSVTCPANQRVQTGSTFTCQATIDGAPREVTITVKTDSGEYEVARPS